MFKIDKRFKNIDYLLFFTIILLLALSLSVLYSLQFNTEVSNLVFRKQVIFSIIGILLFFIFSKINYKVYFTYSKLIYVLGILSLLLVLLLGTEIKGTTGWIKLGSIGIQPVEFIKIALIIYLARFFAENGDKFKLFRYILISGIISSLYVILVMIQPDLGSALVLLGIWIIMLLFTGIQKKHFLYLLSTAIIIITFSWFFIFKTYQKARILTFFDPTSDPLGSGYNVTQSIIAVGSGQLFGRGLALGSQSSLRFLPEPGTDFIFSVIAEDLGILGVLLLLSLFTFLFHRLFTIMKKSNDNFASYFILGILAMLIIQIFINIGMNMGISPITGIPLPLVSAGGSSLIAILIGLGIVENIRFNSN